RHGLPSAFGDRARAIDEALAAFESRADFRMLLEALKFLERRDVRIFIIQMHNEADRDLIVLEMIQKRSAAGLVVERPAGSMLHEPGLLFFRRDLPDSLEAEAEFLRVPPLRKTKTRDQLF